VLSNAVKRSLDADGHVIDAQELPAMTLRGRSTPIDLWCVPSPGRRLQFQPAVQIL